MAAKLRNTIEKFVAFSADNWRTISRHFQSFPSVS
jgi:hypothetical protein